MNAGARMDTQAIDAGHCALVLVDYQERLLPPIREGTRVVAEAVRLADAARQLGIRVVGTEQNSRGLGPNTAAVRERCETTLAKMHFDACADGLVELLREGGAMPTQVVVAGCEAHVCLLQTTLGLVRAGLHAWVVADACGSRRPSDHALAMQRLQGAGAVLVSPEMVLFEWLRSCTHERFKPVLQLIKEG